jgi:hypothetical protein
MLHQLRRNQASGIGRMIIDDRPNGIERILQGGQTVQLDGETGKTDFLRMTGIERGVEVQLLVNIK